MRVNINSNINFRRVVPINYVSLKQAKRNDSLDEGLLELQDILNSTEPFFYSKKESEKIREFFRQKIEDYNGKSGAVIVKTNKGAALLTGKDSAHVKNVIASGYGDNTVASIVIDRVEDGRPGMADSKITLVSNARNKAVKSGKTLSKKDIARFDLIKYQYIYSSKRPEKFVDAYNRRICTAYKTEIYDEATLEI